MTFLEQRLGLRGKVAVVAGGGGGLGRAAALDLARAGVALGLCDVDADALDRFFAEIDGRFDRLDVLVSVVGGTFRAPFTDVSAKGRDALVRANFLWVVDATQHAARRMTESGLGGSIITLTSIEAHRAAPGFAVYAAMKAAVTHLSRTLAVELGPAGIRVNCVAPDFVPTPGLAGVGTPGGTDKAGAGDAGDRADAGDAMAIPLGRKGRPEDVGSCVIFLASDLSSYITGTTLHPDGGALALSGWTHWPGDGYTLRPPTWVLDQLPDGRRGDR